MKTIKLYIRFCIVSIKFVFIFFIFSKSINGQGLIGCFSDKGNTSSNQLFITKIDFINCNVDTSVIFKNIAAADIAIHPNGTLYLVGESLSSINLTSGTIQGVPLPNTYEFYSGMVIDINGLIYLGGRKLLVYNPKTGLYSNKGNLPNDYECLGGITVRDGKFYMSAFSSDQNLTAILELDVNDASRSKVLFTDLEKYHFLSLATFTSGCDEARTFGCGLDKLYEIDFVTGQTSIVCNENIYFMEGATSPSEFLASDPECDLLIDLDRDNSSGLFPYDYLNDAIRCSTDLSTSIVDTDFYLHTTAELNSINLVLMGDIDGTAETLVLPAAYPNATLTFSNGSYNLTLIDDLSDFAWAKAIKAILYIHTGSKPSAGQRSVLFTAYNAIKSNQATAYINIESKPYAGIDTTATLCSPTPINSLHRLLGGDPNGIWQPNLTSYDAYDPALDLVPTYTYITTSPQCGNDTAQLSIVNVPKRSLGLSNTVSLCNAQNFHVKLDLLPNDKVTWNDGSTLSQRILITPDTYTVTVTTAEGCRITESVTLLKSYTKIQKAIDIDLCQGETYTYKSKPYLAGQIIIDSIVALTGCDTLVTISLNTTSTPVIYRDTSTCNNLPISINNIRYVIGDTIPSSHASATGCDTIVYTIYKNYSQVTNLLSIPQPIVCDGQTTVVSFPTTATLDWSDGTSATSTTLPAGIHHVTITDTNGCKSSFEFTIQQALINYSINTDNPTCADSDGHIGVINNDPSLPFVVRINGTKIDSLTNLYAGRYDLIFTDELGCIYTDTVRLLSNSTLDIQLDNIVIADIGQIIALSYLNIGTGIIDTVTFDPMVGIKWVLDSIHLNITNDQVYVITFIDNQGCTVTKSLTVKTNTKPSSYILPNVLSISSNDPENSIFYLKSLGVIYDMAIYDRWGNLMHQAINAAGGDSAFAWSAKDSRAVSGVYVYFISIRTPQGIIQKVGTVTVI